MSASDPITIPELNQYIKDLEKHDAIEKAKAIVTEKKPVEDVHHY